MTDDNETKTAEARAVFDLTTAGRPQMGQVGDFVVVPEGYETVDLEAFQPEPRRARGVIALRETGSFCDYVLRYADARSIIIADWRKEKMGAVLDWHASADAPGFGEHRCIFEAVRTAPWLAWVGAHDKQRSQLEFGRFLEERAHEIVEPEAASVVEVCMNLEAVKSVQFKSSQRLSDGYRQLTYIEEDQTKGGITVPEKFVILVPIYEGQEPVRVDVRLRFRMSDGKLALWTTIDNIDDVMFQAFERCIDAVKVGLGDASPLLLKGVLD